MRRRRRNYFFNVDPISIWQTNQKSLKPEFLADDQRGRRRVAQTRAGKQVLASGEVRSLGFACARKEATPSLESGSRPQPA